MVWATESAYEAAKTAYALYGWFLQEVAADLGWAKALELQGRAGLRLADVLAGALHAKCPRKLDPASVSSVMHDLFRHLATDYDFKTEEHCVTGRYARCPIYDGLAESGMEHGMIVKVCRAFHTHETRKLEAVFPELKLTTKFRDRVDEVCVEQFRLSS